MTTITIDLPDERAQKLKEMADKFGVDPEELVRASVETILSGPEEDFRSALEYVLNKNADLYQRLA